MKKTIKSFYAAMIALAAVACSSPEKMAEMAEKTFHSTTLQAAQTALDAGVKRLLVGHYSSRFPSVDFYLDQIRSIFPDSDLAHDGDKVEIPFF